MNVKAELLKLMSPKGWIAFGAAMIAGSALLSLMEPVGLRRFLFAYLVAYAFVLAIALGSFFLVFVTFAVKASWVVAVRRPAEWMASIWPTLAILFIPIAISVVSNNGDLYSWAQPGAGGGHDEHHAAAVEKIAAERTEFAGEMAGTVVAAADEAGIAMVFTGMRHFRH